MEGRNGESLLASVLINVSPVGSNSSHNFNKIYSWFPGAVDKNKLSRSYVDACYKV